MFKANSDSKHILVFITCFAISLSSTVRILNCQPSSSNEARPPAPPTTLPSWRVTSKPSTSFTECERAAGNGDPDAEAHLASMYATGTSVEASAQFAFHWYQLAAASGRLEAKVNLGVMYEYGMGVARDEAEAAELFRQTALEGEGTAAAYLGNMYMSGRGVPRDADEAERWYARGVKLHSPASAFGLARLEMGDFGHKPNLPRAEALLKKSSRAGYVPATHTLGLLYIRRPELGKSDAALHLLEEASAAGYWRSTVVLAILCRDGKLVPLDLKLAYAYFTLAVLQGKLSIDVPFATDIERLAAQLKPEEVTAMRSQAESWYRAQASAGRIYSAAILDDDTKSFGGRLSEQASSPIGSPHEF